MNENFDYRARCTVEETEKWRDILDEIPFFSIPEKYEIRFAPPFMGAIARFNARNPKNDKSISVYLDFYGRLGAMDNPYWELYPNEEDDIERFGLNDTDELTAAIERILQ